MLNLNHRGRDLIAVVFLTFASLLLIAVLWRREVSPSNPVSFKGNPKFITPNRQETFPSHPRGANHPSASSSLLVFSTLSHVDPYQPHFLEKTPNHRHWKRDLRTCLRE